MPELNVRDGAIIDPRLDAFKDEAARLRGQLSAVDGLADYMQQRIDALILPSDLVALQATLTAPVLSELVARQIFAVDSTAGPAAEHTAYDSYSFVGQARVSSYGGNIPLADANMKRDHQKIVPILTGYLLTIQDVRVARQNGTPIQSTKVAAARRFVAEVENDLIFNGSTLLGFQGVFAIAGGLSAAVTNGNWSLAATTGQQIVEDIRQIKSLMTANDGFTPQALALSSDDFDNLDKFLSTTSVRTAMEFIMANKWFPAGIFKSARITAGKLAVIDNRKEMIEMSVPLDITQYPPVAKNAFIGEIDVEERLGGLLIHQINSVAIGTGI